MNSIKKLKINKLKLNLIVSNIIKFLPINILNRFFNYDENLGDLGRERTLNLIKNFKNSESTYVNSTALLNNDEMNKFTNLKFFLMKLKV